MPSGSHGGSLGSHSSGGSSFGGGSRGGSSFGGGRPRGPRHFRWGRTVYVLPTRQSSILSILKIFILLSFMFAVFGLIFFMGSKQEIKKIETDYYYYQDMITHAEANPEYMKTGYVTDHFYNEDCDKWYYTYKIKREDMSMLEVYLDGYTYSCYTREEIKAIPIDSEIQIAVNTKVVTDKTDSIPLDYKDMPLERDGEYVDAMGERTLGKNLMIICGIAFVGLICVQVFIIAKYKQKKVDGEFGTPQSRDSIDSNQAPKRTTKICDYCGATLDVNAKKCSSCGARLK